MVSAFALEETALGPPELAILSVTFPAAISALKTVNVVKNVMTVT